MKTFENYIKALRKYPVDDVTEHTYRKEIQDLLEEIAQQAKKDYLVQHEPKRKKGFGAPDFKIKTKGEAIIGYVENKKLTDDLSRTVKSDQLKKYQSLSDNIILTNYIEWYWIKDREVIARAKLCDLADLENKMAFALDPDKVEKVTAIITNFYSQAPKGIGKPKQLAKALAVRARFLRDFLHEELERQEKEDQTGRLYGLYDTFKTNVFHKLTQKEFADAFSQTLVYGLFLSKLNAGTKTIDLYNAKQYILPAFGLISELVSFLDVLNNKQYKEAKWIVEEILSVMNTLDLGGIARSLSYKKFKTTKLFDEENISYKDPYIYFYEHFLAAYDKTLRKAKGVYYTPPQVVNFIVRSINDILKKTFGIDNGYADQDLVTVLDFATGTGTFLLEMLKIIFEELPKGSGKKNLLIRDHILKNFYGFEYMIAPYAIANLKLSQFLKEQGYTLKDDDRFQIYLTNTLEPVDPQLKMPLLPTLTKESKAAQKVKDHPILVITGNPPYNVKSKNKGEWITYLIKKYKPADEKKLNIDDDYLKFIRFAHWKMESIEKGVIGIITNNSFLNGITHRKIRNLLMKDFNKIYILNLHGYSRINEQAPEGIRDDNVFDIQQGVSINIFVKEEKEPKKCEVFYQDLWGLRSEKYDWLETEQIHKSKFEKLDIARFNKVFRNTRWSNRFKDDLSFFVPMHDAAIVTEYGNCWGVLEIFNVYGTGVKTDRDSLFFDVDKEKLSTRIDTLLKGDFDKGFADKYNVKDSSSYKLTEKIKKVDFEPDCIYLCNYRPFDKQYVYYKQGLTSRPNYDTFTHLIGKPNIALTVKRQNKIEPFSYSFVFEELAESCLFESAYANNSVFPLYLYYKSEGLFANREKHELTKRDNFTKGFRVFADNLFDKKLSPEQILGYLYAVLHSSRYREKYAEFLKIDFPRIPFTDDKKTFQTLSNIGCEIIDAHLLKKAPAKKSYPYGDFKGKGENIVERREFTESKDKQGMGKLHINKTQYFDNVPTSVYRFYIGGYQVLDKYLKDRKNNPLDLSEVDNIEKVIRVLRFTEEKMREIDNLTNNWI